MLPIDWGNPVRWSHPLNRGLVSWWLAAPNRMGWGSTKWRDLCRRNDGTLTNMDPKTDWVFSEGGGCLDFDGSDDYVNVGDLKTTHPATIIFRVKSGTAFDPFIDNRIFCQSTGVSSAGGAIRFGRSGGGTGDMTIWDGSAWENLIGASVLTTGRWYEIGVTFDSSGGSGTTRGFLDGVLQLATASSNFDFSGVNAGIGDDFTAGGFGTNFSGQFQWFKVYNRELSVSDMAAHRAEAIREFPGLLNRIPLPRYAAQDAASRLLNLRRRAIAC